MISELEKKEKEIAGAEEEIAALKRMLEGKLAAVEGDKKALKILEKNILVSYFLKDSSIKYVHLGEATKPDSEKEEIYGLVVVEHIAFLVWENYQSRNDGRVYFNREGRARELHAVCLCGAGLEAHKGNKSSYKIEEIEESATICKGFFAKEIIAKCVEAAKNLEVSVIFSRHADYAGEVDGVYFREICSFRRWIPFIGKKVLKDFFAESGKALIEVG